MTISERVKVAIGVAIGFCICGVIFLVLREDQRVTRWCLDHRCRVKIVSVTNATFYSLARAIGEDGKLYVRSHGCWHEEF